MDHPGVYQFDLDLGKLQPSDQTHDTAHTTHWLKLIHLSHQCPIEDSLLTILLRLPPSPSPLSDSIDNSPRIHRFVYLDRNHLCFRYVHNPCPFPLIMYWWIAVLILALG